MIREQAEKEPHQMPEESEQGDRHYTKEEIRAYFEEWFQPEYVAYLTGDTHGPV